jgi:phosphate transport system protein
MAAEHIVKAFDSDLQVLSCSVAEMGGLAEKQIADALKALFTHDRDLAREVIGRDLDLDRFQQAIEQKTILTLARRQPMAVDLREIVAALRIANDLERIGDLAKNVAKRVVVLDDVGAPPQLMRGLERMTNLTLSQLNQVLDSYSNRDLSAALTVWRQDEQIDAICTSLFRELLTYMMEDPHYITFCIHVMFSAKNIERIGDHATNIAETVYYIMEGRPITEQRPKRDTTALHVT